MPQLTIEQTLQLARQHHQAGQLPQAEALYRQILQQQPGHADALHLLGVIAYQTGRHDVAVDLIRRAVAINPNLPEAYSNLGVALQAQGQLDGAVAAFRQAVALNPNYPGAYGNLGHALHSQGQLDAAIAACRQAIALTPTNPGAYCNLGNVLQAQGQLDAAIAAYRQAIALNPGFPEVHSNLGNALQAQGQLDAAIAAHRQAIALKPHYPEAWGNLGVALQSTGQLDAALAAFHQAIALKPHYPEAYGNLGVALQSTGQPDAAIAAFRQAVAISPDNAALHSTLLYTLHLHPAYDTQALAGENRRWNLRHAAPLKRFMQPHANDRSPERRLRIGYVSPDFYQQAESFFTIPLLEHHARAACEIFCYSGVVQPDPYTARLRKRADVWRDIRCASDEALAAIIRRDRIDILVDLTMHMANNRALLFARKPAPVQVCWLAYPGGTGLETMDYRLTDSFMDPCAADTACHAEQSIRLPDCWVVYDPLIDLPPRPPEQAGPITFGSLNTPAKLNDPLLTLWAKVLLAVPGSRLLLLVLSLEQRQRIGRLLERLGIAPERLLCAGRMDRTRYLRCYDQIDIALDPLPYNGITTTCDALYMGVPVLTLAGPTAAGRAGTAMLSTIGLGELVAHTQDEFVRNAAQLAANLPRLIELRRGLRPRLAASPLMDAPRFARNIETAYRQMWRQWCATA